MSDSEDDFMSDKFLVEAPTSGPSTYSQRRNAQTLQSLRKGQANNKQTHRQIEEQRRREGLSTSLFDSASEGGTGASASDSASASAAKPKAMELMMKMGWKVGEGLGRRRSPSPESPAKRQKGSDNGDPSADSIDNGSHDEQVARGLGSRPRTEPLRISLWSGRKGLSARSPSPPPLPTSNRNPDALDPKKLERLGQATDDFRTRQRREFEQRETEKKEVKARNLLVQFDNDIGVKFHPLHIIPHDPLETVPRPLLKLLYPAQIYSPASSPKDIPSPADPDPPQQLLPEQLPDPAERGLFKNQTAAEKLREQMRRDMLSELGSGGEGDIRFGIPLAEEDKPRHVLGGAEQAKDQGEDEYQGVDWAEMLSGAKRVLSMDPHTHLTYLLSQLRQEHKYCFWCSFKYPSFEEMDGPGGCPGEDEDDH